MVEDCYRKYCISYIIVIRVNTKFCTICYLLRKKIKKERKKKRIFI